MRQNIDSENNELIKCELWERTKNKEHTQKINKNKTFKQGIMAILQSCCFWKSVRKGSYASVIYTLVSALKLCVCLNRQLLMMKLKRGLYFI